MLIRRSLVAALLLLAAPATSLAQNAADLSWNRGDIPAAETLYVARLARDSSDDRALHRLALIRAWDDRYDESLALFDQLLDISPTNREAAVDRARVLAWRGELPAALEALDVILAEDPSYAPALKARAQFLSWAGQTEDALATYDRLLADLPKDRTLRRDQARVLTWASRYQEATAVYDSLLATDPNDRDALLGLAQLLAWSGQLDSADLVYRRLLGQRPDDAEALKGQARVSAWQGQLEIAERQWRAVIARHPDDALGYVGLAQTLRWSGRTAAAVSALEDAARLAPTDREVLQQLEWVRLMMQPRVRSGLTSESDSDKNDITTLTVGGGWRPTPNLEVSGEAYGRTASLDGAFRRHSYSATAFGLYEVEPGWLLRGGLGLVGSDAPGANVFVRALASVRTPGRYRGGGTFSYARQPLDFTAQLIERGVWTQDVAVAGWYAAGGQIRLNGSASITWFQGSESNRRLAGRIAAERRMAPSWRLGATFRLFGFEKDLQEGYFDPDRYWLGEVVVGWRPTVGAWSFDLVLAPGLQQVGTSGSVQGAGRAAAQVSYAIAPGRDVGAFIRFSSAGMDGFSTANADYRSLAIGLSGSWLF